MGADVASIVAAIASGGLIAKGVRASRRLELCSGTKGGGGRRGGHREGRGEEGIASSLASRWRRQIAATFVALGSMTGAVSLVEIAATSAPLAAVQDEENSYITMTFYQRHW